MFKNLLFLCRTMLAGGLLVTLAGPGWAQAPAGPALRCGFDSVQQAGFRQQPGAEAQYRQFLQAATRLGTDPARGQANALPDVTVPVVVHVIHTGGANNISDAQIHDALRILNDDFSKRNADTASVIPAFRSRIANVGFQFRLAKLDPTGNCTTGITRTYSTLTNVGNSQVKNLIAWDQNRFLNIWVCANANGAGGYVLVPCVPSPLDGVVIRNDHFGSIGTSFGNNYSASTLTHEVGHYFGLSHTWGIANTFGLPSNCGTDDGVADTPNTIGLFNACNLAFSPCTDANGQPILSNVQNFMDYTSCRIMFTTGQRAVMRASLQQLNCRSQLTTAANLQATGTNDGFTGGPCAPVVAFEPSVPKICEGGTVTFTNYSYNDAPGAARAYQWSFPGGTPATSTLPNPTVTYPSGGQYGATLTVTSTPGGSTTLTRTQLVLVAGPNSGLAGPLAESFENPNFPNNFAAPDMRNWAATASSAAALGAAWVRANPPGGGLVASDGAACLWVRSNLLGNNTITWLTSPNINLSAFSAANPPVLFFDRAYAQRPAPVAENLQVQFSADCGLTWTTAVSYSSGALNTMGTLRPNTFVPSAAADWQPLQVTIDPGFVSPYFQVRFQLTSQQGNALYLDHVRFGLPTTTRAATLAKRYDLRLLPSPATAETRVELTLPATSTVQVRLTDLLGRPVLAPTSTRLSAGRQSVALPGAVHLAPGLYLVQVHTGGQTLSTKLLVR